jgi:hypothetical protein
MISESKLSGPELPDPPSAAEILAEDRRVHAAKVEAHQAESGWGPESAVRLADLNFRLGRIQRQPPIGPVPAALAVLAMAVDLALAGFATTYAVSGDGNRADEAVLGLLAMFVPTVWAAWTLVRLVQRRHEPAYRAEREQLLRDRSCGDPDCDHCR